MNEEAPRILLVDDDTAVLQMIGLYLDSLGYDVSATDQPVHALAEATEGAEFDLLITDIIMPRMEGHVLANHLRELIPDLAVILISGYSEAAVDVSSRVRYLAKPFDLEVLKNTIEDVLAIPPAVETTPIDVYFESSQAMAELRVLIDPDYEPPDTSVS